MYYAIYLQTMTYSTILVLTYMVYCRGIWCKAL